MVDDAVVCVDRLIASAYYESENERERLLGDGSGGEEVVSEKRVGVASLKSDCGAPALPKSGNGGGGKCSSEKIARECRICQEDDELQMEAPCACNGTLKFAHRKCIQRWCNKKGDITCEICNQVYSPNYTLPLTRSNPEVMAIDIRQAWAPHIDLRDPHFLALTAAEHQLLQSEYDDFAVATSNSLVCLRSVVVILMLMLFIHQVLMITGDLWMVEELSAFFTFQVSFLKLAGFLLPCFVMARSCFIIQVWRRRQG
ncbi:uncharacterized protein LOC127787827 [Diospyros lotus]|uniref:uncharacterized protein LOC127787827 n=1 Tax=Diospyros lotus TaxID=55363 RepID=UPI00225004DF|nr:uncharacterized protein LOC127787827 [Diospyros lotus]